MIVNTVLGVAFSLVHLWFAFVLLLELPLLHRYTHIRNSSTKWFLTVVHLLVALGLLLPNFIGVFTFLSAMLLVHTAWKHLTWQLWTLFSVQVLWILLLPML